MALYRVVCEKFNVEKCRDHQIRVKVHSRSLKVVQFDRACMVSYSIIIGSDRGDLMLSIITLLTVRSPI